MSVQTELWQSQFGIDYTHRNDCERGQRYDAWRDMVGGLGIESALEVGSNVGWNLHYLGEVGIRRRIGVEPGDYAVRRGAAVRPDVTFVRGVGAGLAFRDASVDLAFTCGVLIHVPPQGLSAVLGEMYRVARRYILYVEYDDHREVEVRYRGRDQALWRRNHRQAWLTQFPELRLLRSGTWGADHGFDDCGWCLFAKPDVECAE